MDTRTSAKEYYAFDSLNWHFNYWTFLGIRTHEFPKKHQRILYRIHTALICIGVQIFLPFHLIFGVLQLRNTRDILETTSICINVVICAMKAYFLKRSLGALQDINQISRRLERKAKRNEDEYAFLLEFKSTSGTIMKTALVLVTSFVLVRTMIVLRYGSMYPGYFPYDIHQSRLVYGLSAFYQLLALVIQAFANQHHDSYPGLLIFLLSQHLRIFNLRVSKIGYDSNLSIEENHQLLIEAVKDHRQILRCHRLLNNAISKPNFALLLSSSLNIVSYAVLFTFFADNLMEKVFYMQFAIGYAFQIVLSCYYGSQFEANDFKVSESFYSCNWYEQSNAFRKDLCIFLECSLRKSQFIAGGLLPVSKGTFARILSQAFSLFAVLNTLRQKFEQ